MSDHVPHIWVQVEPVTLQDGRSLVSSDVVCRRCGVRLYASQAAAFDRVPGYADCDEQLALAVMES